MTNQDKLKYATLITWTAFTTLFYKFKGNADNIVLYIGLSVLPTLFMISLHKYSCIYKITLSEECENSNIRLGILVALFIGNVLQYMIAKSTSFGNSSFLLYYYFAVYYIFNPFVLYYFFHINIKKLIEKKNKP